MLVLIAQLGGCGASPERKACDIYLECAEIAGSRWDTLDAEDTFGPEGTCWTGPDPDACGPSCYARAASLPVAALEDPGCRIGSVDRGLLTSDSFRPLYERRFCDAHAGCNSFNRPCAIQYPDQVCPTCPDGSAFSVAGCFDTQAAAACLEATFTCVDDVPAGEEYVARPPECDGFCQF